MKALVFAPPFDRGSQNTRATILSAAIQLLVDVLCSHGERNACCAQMQIAQA
jgi:hypothetical protein